MWVREGEKPEVRIGNQFGFNITKQASFKDIHFTGIDNLALDSGTACNLLLYPVSKCNVVEDPSGKLEEL